MDSGGKNIIHFHILGSAFVELDYMKSVLVLGT